MTTSISELSAQVRQLRRSDSWWKNPMIGRLAAILAAALVVSILTNKVQGSSSDYTLLFKSSWFSGRGPASWSAAWCSGSSPRSGGSGA